MNFAELLLLQTINNKIWWLNGTWNEMKWNVQEPIHERNFFFFHSKTIHQWSILTWEKLGFDGVLSLRESFLALLLFKSLGLGLWWRKSSSDGSSLLGTEIFGDILLGLVELTKLLSLSEVDDSQNSGNGLSNLRDLSWLNIVVGSLLDTEFGELLLETSELFLKLSLGLVAKFRSFNTNL